MNKQNTIIHSKVNNDFSLVYSYTTGHFYLVSSKYIPKTDGEYRTEKRFIAYDELDLITSNALNPSELDVANYKSPIVTGLMVSNECNLKCCYCIAKNGNGYSKDNILLNDIGLIINRIKNSNILSVLVSGGEPTINADLTSFLRELRQLNVLCLLDTNGVKIDKLLVEVLKESYSIIPRISLDSINEEIHNKNRGGYSQTIQNVDKLLNENIDLRINTVIHADNIDTLSDMAKWLIGKKISKWHLYKLQLKYAPERLKVDDEQVEQLINMLMREYSDDLSILCKYKNSNDNFSSFMIDSEGWCFSSNTKEKNGNVKTIFGNVFSNSIEEIWQNTPDNYKLNHYRKYLAFHGKEY